MKDWAKCRVPAVWFAVSMAVVLFLVAGCHSNHQSGEGTLLQSLTKVASSSSASQDPIRLAEDGSAAITAECERQSYDDARKKLILSETGLNEDVFTLKAPGASQVPIAFGLDDALRLEDLLQKKLQGVAQTEMPTQCVQKFEIYLEALTDPMVERGKLTKQEDASAYNAAAKQAQDELEREKQTEALAPKDGHPN